MKSWLFLERLFPAHRRQQRGQTLVIFAFLAIFMILLLGLVLDTARLFIVAAQAERVAEAASLAGALYMPTYFNTAAPLPDGHYAVQRACQIAQENGISACPVGTGQIGVDVEQVTGNQYEIQVTVTMQADVFFLAYVAPNLASATVSRSAAAQYLPAIQLGSRSAAFGDEADGAQSFWASINGPYELKEQGDAYTPKWEEGPTDPVNYPDATSTIYNFSRWTPTQCCTNHQQWPTPITNPDKQSAGFTDADGTPGYSYEIVVPAGVGNVKVQIYNADFDPSYSNTTNDSLGSACDDPTFSSCPKDQSNEYLQMHYSLYSAPLQFERSTDTLLTSFAPASLDYYGDHTCPSTEAWNPVSAACATPTNHSVEDWYTLYTIPNLTTATTYRLTVAATGYYGFHSYGIKLTDASSVSVTSAAPGGTALGPATDGPHIWGWNNECVHFDAAASTAIFDLGEIPAAYAGKTLDFSLFDPGDVNAPATNTMEILDPSGNPVQWPSWARTALGSGGTKLNASIAGDRYYNGLWLHVPVSIPATYNPAAGSDWWQVEYSVLLGAAHDTITISISLGGSPVHLVSEVVG